MTRKKVKLVLISNDSARKACLKKRRIGLLKKVSELTVLCGVDAFCIIYSPGDNDPVIWPSPPMVHHLFTRYLNLPNIERCKKSMTQESYLKERIEKAEDLSIKNQNKNKDMELNRCMKLLHQGQSLDDFALDELASFVWLVQERMIDITKRIEYINQMPPLSSSGDFPIHDVANMIETSGLPSRDHGMVNSQNVFDWDHWFVENVNNNNDLGSSGITAQDDIGVPYGVTMNTHVANSVLDMGIENSFYGDVDPHANIIGGLNMECPDLLGNFHARGLSNNNTIGGFNTIRLPIPNETLLSGVDYGGFGFMRPIHNNLLGCENSDKNISTMKLGMIHGSWDICDNYQASPNNVVKGRSNGRNWNDQMVLLNANIIPRLENQMTFRGQTNENITPNVNKADWNNFEIGLGLSNDQIDCNINSRGCSIARSSDMHLQVGLFGSTSDVGFCDTTGTTNNNNDISP